MTATTDSNRAAHEDTTGYGNPSPTRPAYLNETQAADFLALSPKTLSRWRWAGKGPHFHKFGGTVRYNSKDLEAFADASRQAVGAN